MLGSCTTKFWDICDTLNWTECSKKGMDPTSVPHSVDVPLSHTLFSPLRTKTCCATSSRHPCASSSLLSLPPPPPAGPRSSPSPHRLSSRARCGPHSQPAWPVPRPPVWTPSPPRTAQGGCGWPPSRRTPAATLTWERRPCRTISQPEEPARRLRNPPSRIWPIRTQQPGTDGALSGRTASKVKRRSAERKQGVLFVRRNCHAQASWTWTTVQHRKLFFLITSKARTLSKA